MSDNQNRNGRLKWF